MRDAKFVIVTANGAGAKVVRQNFGTRTEVKFVVVMFDESAMIKESDLWIAMVKLTAHKKITAFWMFGDHLQLVPLIVSLGVGLNPFAMQLQLTLHSRLTIGGHETFQLVLSGRMHHVILKFPNDRTYRGKLKATKAANERILPNAYPEWYTKYFGLQVVKDNCRLIGLLVDGVCTKVIKTGSKYNMENAANIVHMVNSIRESKAFPMKEITILTMYGRERVIVSSMLTQVAKQLGLRRDAFPAVLTVDSFQARESTMVILDTTVTDDLGFVDDENRMNMACTRARDVFILVGSPSTMAKSVTGSDDKGKSTSTHDKYTSGRRRVTDANGNSKYRSSPYVADYLQSMSVGGNAVDAMHTLAELKKTFRIDTRELEEAAESLGGAR